MSSLESTPAANFSERQRRKATGVRRDTIRAMRHGKGVKRCTFKKAANFVKENVRTAHDASPVEPAHHVSACSPIVLWDHVHLQK